MSHWSHSKLTRYEKCPYQLVLGKLHKQTPNEYAERGVRIHEAIEKALNKQAPIPELPYFTDDIAHLIEQNAQPELRWGVNADWTPSPEPYPWGVCVIDALVRTDDYLLIVDFKTGKLSPISHQDQAQTYAITAHAYYPQYTDIHTQFWYLDSGKVAQTSYTPALIHRYRSVLESRINRMLNDQQRRPRPNKYVCQWCAYKEHCEYNAST